MSEEFLHSGRVGRVGVRPVYDATPANAVSITLTGPEDAAEPRCLLSDDALVGWPRGRHLRRRGR